MNLLMNLLAPFVYVLTGLVSAPITLWLLRREIWPNR